MGTLIIPDGFAQMVIAHRHSAFSREALVTFGVSLVGTPTSADVDALVDAYDSAYGSAIDDNVTMGPGELIVGSLSGENLVISGTTTEVGSQAGTAGLNQGQALLIHKRTLRGGRRGRGRMYIPWLLLESQVSDTGVIDSAYLATLQTASNTFLNNIAALAAFDDMRLLHSESGDDVENPSVPGSPNAVTSLTVDPIVGSQRRRLGR